jgi:hypothetical protein
MSITRFARATVVAVAIAGSLGTSTASAGEIVARRDGSKAVDVPAVAVAPAPARSGAGKGFHLDDAGLGAAAMLALVLASTGVVSLRARRQPVPPASP